MNTQTKKNRSHVKNSVNKLDFGKRKTSSSACGRCRALTRFLSLFTVNREGGSGRERESTCQGTGWKPREESQERDTIVSRKFFFLLVNGEDYLVPAVLFRHWIRYFMYSSVWQVGFYELHTNCLNVNSFCKLLNKSSFLLGYPTLDKFAACFVGFW